MAEKNLISLMNHHAIESPHRAAIREKRYGVWSPITWKEFQDKVQDFALGLRACGLRKDDKAAILGDNKPEWIIAELGSIAAGGIITGIYPDSLADEALYLIRHSDSRFLVVSDQEQVDKVLKIWPELKDQIAMVIIWDSRGMGHYYSEYPFLKRFEDILKTGREEAQKNPDFIIQRAEKILSTQPAMMLTTSGTTSKPKLAILSHENLIFAAESYGQIVKMDKNDELISLAPLPWIGEQMYTVTRFLQMGVYYNFPEEPETLRRDLVELQPSYFGGTPSRWEDIVSQIQAAIDNSDFVKKFFYRKSIKMAMKRVEENLAGRDTSSGHRLVADLLHFFVLRPLKNKLGLGRVKVAITGGGAISPEVFKYFKALDLDIRQIYGQSECSGIATSHRENDVRPETVGLPIPGVEVKTSPEGEILVKGKSVMLGYYRNEKASSEAFTEDGFLRTGDAGFIGEDGHLYVFDRFKDMMTLTTGTRFAPQDIETRLKFSPYIREIVVCGTNKPFVGAIISIDLENVGNWAKNRRIPFTTYQDLSQRTEVYQLIKEEILRLSESFPREMRVKRFAILIKELHPDDEELTRTRKARRALIYQRYGGLLEDLYEGIMEHHLDIQIRYEDGRISAFKGKVGIEEVWT